MDVPSEYLEGNESRFSTIFATGPCPKPLYDEVLFETTDCVATPTLGSILPNWILVIPRLRVLNFALWYRRTLNDPTALITHVAAACNVDVDRLICFEHGAVVSSSVIGCGVEHAHLHVLIDVPFSFHELTKAAQDSCRLCWRSQKISDAYSQMEEDQSYLLVALGGHALVATEVESVGPQFFRRVIARLVGLNDGWDYRKHPHIANVERTIRNLQGMAR